MRREQVRRTARRSSARRRARLAESAMAPAPVDEERLRLLERCEELLEIIDALVAERAGA